MEFSYPFDEYQPPYAPFGSGDLLPPISPQPFFGEQDSIFHENPSTVSCDDDMSTSVYAPDDFSVDSTGFSTETGSPVLPNSVSVTESPGSASPASSSPLSSPGGSSVFLKQEPSDSSVFVKQEPIAQQQALFSSIDMSAKTVSYAPERKKKRSAEPKPTARKQQQTGKKRKAQSEPVEELNPQNLIQMSSIELEEMHQRLQTDGHLKVEDDKLLKKIIRQVKNRESAQASRIRRRDHMEYIEAKLKHEEIVSASWRNYSEMLKGLLIQHGVEVPPEPEIPAFVPPTPTDLTEPSRTLVRPLRTAGICLMLVVLSVGVLFNAMHHSNSNNSISNVSGGSENTLVSQSNPAVDASARVIVEANAPITSQLPEATAPEPAPAQESTELSKPAEVATLDVIRKSAYLSYDTDKTDSSLALVVSDQKQQVAAAPSSAVSSIVPATCPLMGYTTKAIFGNNQPHVADRTWCLDNTSYILVNDATEFVPRNAYSGRGQTRTEPVIGLLLPASSFNLSNTAPDDVVELICGVRNANLVPRSVLANTLY